MDRSRACNEVVLTIFVNIDCFVNMIFLQNYTLLRGW